MATKSGIFNQAQLKQVLPDIRPGDRVRIYQKIKENQKKDKSSKEEGRKRVQIFEGVVLARKHGKEISATITVRRIISGIGVEKIFPLHSPNIEKIELLKRRRVKRAKLYYLRKARGKKARLKKIEELKESIGPLKDKLVVVHKKTRGEKQSKETENKKENP